MLNPYIKQNIYNPEFHKLIFYSYSQFSRLHDVIFETGISSLLEILIKRYVLMIIIFYNSYELFYVLYGNTFS